MQLQEIIRRAEKELSTATRNLDVAKRRGAPEQDVRNLEAKLEYRKAVLEILKDKPLELFEKVEQLEKKNDDLLARAEAAEARCNTLEKMVKEYREVIIPRYVKRIEQVKQERDAAISDLERAEKIAEETYTLLDREIQPVFDYSVYTAIHDSVSDIVDWKKDIIWRKEE